MEFKEWLSKYANVSKINDFAQLKNSLELLDSYNYYVINQSSTSNIGISEAIHIRRKGDGKIYGHLIIEKGNLLLGKSRASRIERDSASQIIPMLLHGEKVDSKISNISNCVILNKENIKDFVEVLCEVSTLNKES